MATAYGKVAKSEGEKAANRASLQKSLSAMGTSSSQVNGSVVVNKPSVITSSDPRKTTSTSLKDLGTMTYGNNYGLSNQDPADDAYNKLIESAQNAPKTSLQLQYERQAKGLVKQIDSLSSSLDANSRALMESIKGEYADLVAQQEVTNKAYQGGINVEGMVSGREQYAPNLQGGIVANAINQGISKVAEINNKKNKALAEAENARIQGQFQLMSKKMEVARQLAIDERDAIQQTLENTVNIKKQVKADMEEYANVLAPAVVDSLTGDEETDRQFIADTALQTGGKTTPENLYKAVTDYQNARRKETTDSYTSDIKEFNFAKEQGYTGTLLDFIKAKQVASASGSVNKGGNIYEALKAAGIPLGSPIYAAIGNLPLNTKEYFAGLLSDAYAKGDDVAINRIIASIAFQNSSQSDKDKFTLASAGIPRIDRILTKLETFKNENKDLSGIKNAKEWLKRAATMTNDQDFIDLASEIGLTQVQIRNKFFGSALTGTEQNVAKDFLVQFDKIGGDTVENMISKMKNLKNALETDRQAVLGSFAGEAPGEEAPALDGGIDFTSTLDNIFK